MSIRLIELSERVPCRHCGDRMCFEKGYGPEFELCSECAEEIANLYWLVHAGERLTDRPARPASKPMLSQADKWRILRRDGFCCQSCGAQDRPLHVDHVIARINGGSDADENLQALCDKCNLQKGAS